MSPSPDITCKCRTFQMKNTANEKYDNKCRVSRLERTKLFLKMEIETENAFREKEQEEEKLLKKIKERESRKKNLFRKIRKIFVRNCCHSKQSNSLRHLGEKLGCLRELLPLYRIFRNKCAK
ncbi:uncharacterized protein LOC144431275 [Styela clava]